jgi:serine/threonine protein kinase
MDWITQQESDGSSDNEMSNSKTNNDHRDGNDNLNTIEPQSNRQDAAVEALLANDHRGVIEVEDNTNAGHEHIQAQSIHQDISEAATMNDMNSTIIRNEDDRHMIVRAEEDLHHPDEGTAAVNDEGGTQEAIDTNDVVSTNGNHPAEEAATEDDHGTREAAAANHGISTNNHLPEEVATTSDDKGSLVGENENDHEGNDKVESTTSIHAHDDDVDFTVASNAMNNSAQNLSATAFTSDTASTARKLNMIGTSHSQMSVHTGSQPQQCTIYGRPVHVNDSNGSFPNVASILGPYFCLGQLGKGTFSSIHKCIDMEHYFNTHRDQHKNDESSSVSTPPERRHQVVAAKVELSGFQQSGVLESEAVILDYLHRHVQPTGTVPTFVGHYRSDKFAAILMEFLPGEDMHQIRERVMAATSSIAATGTVTQSSSTAVDAATTRRMSIRDVIELTADIMLPLLRSIHEVGVVHRDVKPSNCVRKLERADCKEFCMVDFGLSKSIIVPEDSELADKEHLWDESKPWMKPLNYSGTKACFRQERTKADFRGTSMYASLRVHQGKDYCPRDDMWSLLYVFCDLVSGGLPWMSMAANRDRSACQKMKEWVHGEGGDGTRSAHIDEMLKGDAYHIAKYRRERQKEAKVDAAQLSAVPEPLRLSRENDKVFALGQAFEHVASLQFWETPDYDKIQSSIRCFAEKSSSNLHDPPIPSIEWSNNKPRPSKSLDYRSKHWWSNTLNVPEWILPEDNNNRLDFDIFDETELTGQNLIKVDNFRTRLPIELRFHLAQMDYNLAAASDDTVPMHRALHDWMRVVLPLLHQEWNARKYEDGGHRTATDGFKRARYLELLQQCEKYAKGFQNFQSLECFYETSTSVTTLCDDLDPSSVDLEQATKDGRHDTKRRKVVVYPGSTSGSSTDFILVSKTLFGLRVAIRAEMAKKAPPPVRISFG